MSEDFHRTNINLHRADVDWLVHIYGYGWTEKVRDIIHNYIESFYQDTVEDLSKSAEKNDGK